MCFSVFCYNPELEDVVQDKRVDFQMSCTVSDSALRRIVWLIHAVVSAIPGVSDVSVSMIPIKKEESHPARRRRKSQDDWLGDSL